MFERFDPDSKLGRRSLQSSLESTMIFHITMHPEEDGWVVVECPALPGCVSQGRDEKEAVANIKEAITAWLWAEDQKALDNLPKDAHQMMVAL